MANRTFTCWLCHCIFEPGLTEEEAVAQLAEEFPGASVEDCELVCEDCWERIKPVTASDDEE